MKKIAVFNQKGGVGKTTVAVNIAACLGNDFNKKVLVVDCDPQMNSTKYLTTFREESYGRTLEDIIRDKKVWPDDIIRVSLEHRRKMIDTKIYLLPASVEINSLEIEDPLILKDAFSEMEKDYDFAFFDCPSDLNSITLAVLSCVDYVIVPVKPITDAMGGYGLLLDAVNDIRRSGTNISLKILGIFFIDYDKRLALQKYLVEDNRKNMGDMVFSTIICRSSAVEQARYYGKPLTYYKHNDKVTKDFINLAKEIMKKARN